MQSPPAGTWHREGVGKTLQDLVVEFPDELVGRGWRGPHFPLLEKFIDASHMLPVPTLMHLSEDSKSSFDQGRVGEAVRRGTAAGALACTNYGAMRALPMKDELERFMAGGG